MRAFCILRGVRCFYTLFRKEGEHLTVDGSLIFNTKIDEDGFNKGAKGLSSKVVDLKNKISATEAAIKNLKAEMEKTGNVKVKTKAIEGLEKDIAKADSKLQDLRQKAIGMYDERVAELMSTGLTTGIEDTVDRALEQDKVYQKLVQDIQRAEEQLRKYEIELERVNNAAPLTKDTADFQKKQQRLDELSGQLDVYRAKLREAEQAEARESAATATASERLANAKRHLERTITALKLFANGATKAGSALKTAFSKTAGKMIQNIGAHFRRANSSTNILEKSLRRIKNTLVRMFFFRLVHSPLDAVKDGLGEIAKVSPEVNKNLSALKTESTYLKNTLASLAAPLVNLITPAFTSFMQTLSGVTEKAGQLVALLTGQTYTKAVKVQQDYAASLDDSTTAANKNTKALEKNQRALAGFDELNVLEQNDDSNDSESDTASSPMFENVNSQVGSLSGKLIDLLKNQDFDAVGKMFGEKINSALKKIKWNKIKATVKGWASNIAGFFNGFVKNTDWSLVGSTIGEGINTAVLFAKTFFNKVKWNELGKSAATLINKAFSKISWKKVGLTISSGINAFFSSTNGFFSTLNWAGIGTSIRAAIVTAIKNIDWETVKNGLVTGINGFIDLAIAFVGEPDFKKLGENVERSLESMIKSVKWKELSHLFFGFVTGIFAFTNGFVLKIDWTSFGEEVANSFNNFFGEGGDGRHLLNTMGETIGNFILGTSDFIIAFFQDPNTADNFSDAIGECFSKIPWIELIVNSITGGIEIGTWIIKAATNLVENFCKGLSAAFSDSKDNPEMKKAVQNLGIAVINLLITGFESGLKILVNAIPNVILSAIKVVLTGLSWLLSIVLGSEWRESSIKGMEDWKWDIPVSIPRVPYLATGTYIPANYGEFLAVLGDNKREAEVVSPVSAMKQAFLEALAEGNFSGGDGEKEINLYIDGDKFFTWLVGKNNRYQKSHGKSAFGGVN